MAGLGRDVPYRDKIAWSPLMLVVGAALQVVLLMVAFAVMLSVPALTLDALESTQSVVGTVAWMNGLSSFVASLLVLFIVRRRLRSVAMLVVHSAVPAAVVSAVNVAGLVVGDDGYRVCDHRFNCCIPGICASAAAGRLFLIAESGVV